MTRQSAPDQRDLCTIELDIELANEFDQTLVVVGTDAGIKDDLGLLASWCIGDRPDHRHLHPVKMGAQHLGFTARHPCAPDRGNYRDA